MSITRRRLLDDSYKKSVVGNPAIATGSLARMNPGITMQGWTEQNSTEGKNLFDRSSFAKAPSSGGIVSIPILLKRNTQYVFSDNYGEWNGTGLYLFISSDGTQDGRNEYLINSNLADRKTYVFTTDDSENFYLCSYDNGVSIILESASEIQIEEGSVATKYEPYTGGQPSPNPDYPQPITSAGKYNEDTQKYEYQVKLTGKNLWNAEEAAETSKWVESTSQTGHSDFAIDVIPGQKVTVSFPEKLPDGILMYVAIVLKENGKVYKWLYYNTQASLIFQKQTVTALENKIWIRCNTSSIARFVSGNPYFQVEYGEERTDFQPYKEQTVTLTADRPLTKWDKLEKRNGQWGWVYKSKRFTSNDMIGFNDTWMPSMVWSIKNKEDYAVPNKAFYCEYFKVVRASNVVGSGLEINVKDYPEIQTADDMARFVNSKEGSELPVTVCAETIQETFVPLSESEQELMNALYTFRPTTVLSNDQECEMTLTYKTRKSMEVIE